MPKYQETRHLPYSPGQMFALVADVGSYQQFLPWVIGTRVRSKSDRAMLADMIVGFKMFRETFTSQVNLEPPDHIHIDYVEGPLKFLYNDWKFAPDGQGGCHVDFCVDFAFRSAVFETLAGAVFTDATRKMIGAFEERAKQLYGAGSGSSSSSSAHLTA